MKHNIFTHDKIIVLSLFITCFLIHLLPRFMVYNWFVEEECVYMVVESLLGNNPAYAGFYPSLTQRLVVGLSFFGTINPEMIAKLINPFFVALTLIPLYFLVKGSLTRNQTYAVMLFWTFSEVVFYRTAHFSSTETVSFFFAVLALTIYQKAKTQRSYVSMLACLGLSLWSHVLPAIVIIGTIFIHKFLFSSNLKGKIISFCLVIGVGLILFSPFSPHLRVIDVGNPIAMLSNLSISNLFLYSTDDLLAGVQIFLGLLVLLVLSIPALIFRLKSHKILFSLLLVSALFFIFSWIAYSPQIFAPPRLTLYFIIPLSYYAVLTIWEVCKKETRILFIVSLIIIMLVSISNGLQPMLWINNAMTQSEYQALQDNKDIITDTYDWWCDYPVRIAITRMTLSYITQSPTNETKAITDSEMFVNYSATIISNNATHTLMLFKYVFYSERISTEGLFILYYGHGRSQQVREPIPNVWESSLLWKLIYTNEEVKIYERLD